MANFGLSDLTWVLAIVAAWFGVPALVRWAAPQARRIMSRRVPRVDTPAPAMDRYTIPSRPTSIAAQTTPASSGGMDAENWQPKLPRYPDERELIVYLATIRHKNGKYQKSANQIVTFVGGDRNTVLRLVREVRSGVPEFPPTTPAQEVARRELGLLK